jgi:hypothetical protein
MSRNVIKRPRDLEEEPKFLSPPLIVEPLYQCATSVTVIAFAPHATLTIEVDGLDTSAPGGFPNPNGATVVLPSPLVAGQKVRAMQKTSTGVSDWSSEVVVGDHTKDFPAGPPRPEVNPAPVHECGNGCLKEFVTI